MPVVMPYIRLVEESVALSLEMLGQVTEIKAHATVL